MRFGSVCSGIEAASVAFHELGWEAAWLSEVDVAAAQVLAYRLGATAPVYPMDEKAEKRASKLTWGESVTNWGDMTRLPDLIGRREAEAPDVLCGGTPCQAFSNAGRRQGLADARGNLTLTFIDIADAIDEQRAQNDEQPCIIFWENVPGVLSSKDNAFGCFLAGLAGEDEPLVPAGKRWSDAGVVLGPERAVAWRILDAQFFGLAQRRRRVFVVASAREGFDPGAILFEFEGVRRDTPPSRETGEDVAGTLDARTSGGGFPETDGACAGHVVPGDRGASRVDSTHTHTHTHTASGLVGRIASEPDSRRGASQGSDDAREGPVSRCAASGGWPVKVTSTLNAHFGEKQGLEDQHVNQGCPLFVLGTR